MAVGCLQNGDDFSFLPSFKRTIRNKWIIKFLRRLKEGHSRFVDVKIPKQLKNGRARTQLQISSHAVWNLIVRGEIIGNYISIKGDFNQNSANTNRVFASDFFEVIVTVRQYVHLKFRC